MNIYFNLIIVFQLKWYITIKVTPRLLSTVTAIGLTMLIAWGRKSCGTVLRGVNSSVMRQWGLYTGSLLLCWASTIMSADQKASARCLKANAFCQDVSRPCRVTCATRLACETYFAYTTNDSQSTAVAMRECHLMRNWNNTKKCIVVNCYLLFKCKRRQNRKILAHFFVVYFIRRSCCTYRMWA